MVLGLFVVLMVFSIVLIGLGLFGLNICGGCFGRFFSELYCMLVIGLSCRCWFDSFCRCSGVLSLVYLECSEVIVLCCLWIFVCSCSIFLVWVVEFILI